MAKMKIYEIARSIQQQDKNIKSGDLVTLLNENGFEVKGANSNIEDEAIGFLMNYFKKKKANGEYIDFKPTFGYVKEWMLHLFRKK